MINEHINNILSDELNENEVVRKFGKTEFSNLSSKQLYYNLDIILAIGYRVNSIRGIEFRKWANQYGRLSVLYTTKVHDRYIIIDNKDLYLVGGSIKDLGKKIFSIIEMDNSNISKLLNRL